MSSAPDFRTRSLGWHLKAKVLRPLPRSSASPQRLRIDGGTLGWNPNVATIRREPAALSVAECGQVLQLATERRFVDGKIPYGAANRRRCQCTWLPPDDAHAWLYARIGKVFERANELFMFRIIGLVEPLMVVSYEAGGGFDWHLDAGDQLSANRKLSLSIPLSSTNDYTGGDLQFAGSLVKARRIGKGTAVVFPSFVAHRVSPVVSGRRFALVAFAHGPSFE